jgi:hypothetical protein
MVHVLAWVLLLAAAGLPAAAGYKLVVLGDIHGDMDHLRAILEYNGVLDVSGAWLDPSTHVVSVGDTVGRGHQDQDVLEFVKEMSEQHNWHQQLGNHEIMQLREDWRYVVDGEGIGFGSLEAREQALARGSPLGDWLRTLPPVRVIADNVFIHAGMYDRFNIGRTVEEMHAEIREFLEVSQPRHVYNDLIWGRDMVRDAEAGVPGTCDKVAEAIAGFPGARRLFVGHTTTQSLAGSNEPLVYCDGTLYAVDVGISRWMSNNPVNMQLEIDEAGQTVRLDTIRTPIEGGGQLLVPVETTGNTPNPHDNELSRVAGGSVGDGGAFFTAEATDANVVALLLLIGGAVMVALIVSSKHQSLNPKRTLTSSTWRTRLQEHKYAKIARAEAAESAV